jgi:hypothetical protein
MQFSPRKILSMPIAPQGNQEEKTLWGYESSYAKVAYYFRTGIHITPSGGLNFQPLERIVGALDEYKNLYESGEKLAVISALRTCCDYSLPMPEWLAKAFKKETESLYSEKDARTLDEIFPFVPGKRTTRNRVQIANRDNRFARKLSFKAWEIAQADSTIVSMDKLLELVLADRKFPVAKTKARKLIEEEEKRQHVLMGNGMGLARQSISQFLEKRRKQ